MRRLGRSFGCLVVVCSLWALAACAPGAPNATSSAIDAESSKVVEEEAVPAAKAGPAAGLLVSVDPQTGELVAPDETQLEAMGVSPELLNALSRSAVGLESEELPGGGEIMRLDSRFQSMSFARLRPDGTFEKGHGLPEELWDESNVAPEGGR